MGPGPKDIYGHEVKRELKKDFAVNDGQIPNGCFLRKIERILPILGISFRQSAKTLRIQLGGKNHLGMPEHGDEHMREEKEEEDRVPSRSRFQQRERVAVVVSFAAVLLSLTKFLLLFTTERSGRLTRLRVF